MQLKKIDLHHKNAEEALAAVQATIDFMVKHNEAGVAFDHGKGIHSRKVAVLRQEIRRMFEERSDLDEAGYIVISGDDQYPVADAFNEGYVLVVKQEYLNESTVEGDKQREKAHIVWSEEGKEIRKNAKRIRQGKRHKLRAEYVIPSREHDFLFDEDDKENDSSESFDANSLSNSVVDVSGTFSSLATRNDLTNYKNTSMRLAKVAKEFNVGIPTLVDFLRKMGHYISSSPCHKISEEQYTMIKNEFNPDVDL